MTHVFGPFDPIDILELGKAVKLKKVKFTSHEGRTFLLQYEPNDKVFYKPERDGFVPCGRFKRQEMIDGVYLL